MPEEAAPEKKDPPSPGGPRRGVREFVMDNAIVALAMLIAKLRGILTLPLIVGAIGTAGYGVWSQILAFVTLLASIVSWNLHLPLVRFIAADRKSAPRIYTTILVLEMALTAAGAALLLPFSRGASDVLLGDPGLGKHLAVGLAFVFVSNIRLVNLNVYRAYDRFLARSVVELATSVFELAAIIVVLIKTHDIFAALVTMTIWGTVAALFTTWHAGRLTGFGLPSRAIAMRALAYAVPLLPTALSLWILDRADRFFIGHYLGAKEVGIYSASYAIGGLVIQAQMPFQMTLFPKVAALWDTDRAGAKRYIELSNKFFLTLAIPFTAACAVMAPHLLLRLGNKEIAENSALLTTLVSAGVTLYGVSVMQIQVLHGARRTSIQGAISIAAAIFNVGLNVALLRPLGTEGAAIATLAAYAFTCVALNWVARKYLAIAYYPLYLLKSLTASLMMLAPMYLLAPHGVPGLVAAVIAGVPVYFGGLWALRAFDATELDFVRRAWKKITNR